MKNKEFEMELLHLTLMLSQACKEEYLRDVEESLERLRDLYYEEDK